LAVVLARDIPDVVAVEHIGSTAIPGCQRATSLTSKSS
jgi:GrpB-like predicted nucleotidyltransferase (UPF0157 family)